MIGYDCYLFSDIFYIYARKSSAHVKISREMSDKICLASFIRQTPDWQRIETKNVHTCTSNERCNE